MDVKKHDYDCTSLHICTFLWSSKFCIQLYPGDVVSNIISIIGLTLHIKAYCTGKTIVFVYESYNMTKIVLDIILPKLGKTELQLTVKVILLPIRGFRPTLKCHELYNKVVLGADDMGCRRTQCAC